LKFLLTIITFCVSALVSLSRPVAGAPAESASRSSLQIRVENRTYDQILQIFHQQTSLEYEVPPEFGRQRLPLVEINGLSPKDALMKILEGSNYDFILIGSPGNTGTVTRLIVTARSVHPRVSGGSAMPAASASMNRRVNRQQIVEDPFGGDVDMGFDEGNMEPMVVTPAQENPPPQAGGPGQQGPQPAGIVPQQQAPPGQAQPLQQASPPGQQQQLGQPLSPMTPQQTIPGYNQVPPQTNVPQDRRSPF
jgi:hypothetical protein